MRCDECKWWNRFGLLDEESKVCTEEGFCQKYSPKIVKGMLFCAPDISGEADWTKQEFPNCWDNQEAIWPKTLDFWWCGEFEKKIGKL